VNCGSPLEILYAQKLYESFLIILEEFLPEEDEELFVPGINFFYLYEWAITWIYIESNKWTAFSFCFKKTWLIITKTTKSKTKTLTWLQSQRHMKLTMILIIPHPKNSSKIMRNDSYSFCAYKISNGDPQFT